MLKYFLSGKDWPAIRALSDLEMREASRFASDPASLDDARHIVASGLARLINDYPAAPAVSKEIFDGINDLLERTIYGNSAIEKRSPIFPEPRILARTFGYPPVGAFLCSAFGVRERPLRESDVVSGHETSVFEFAFSAFQEEIGVVRKIERPLPAPVAAHLIWDLEYRFSADPFPFESWQKATFGDRGPTHAFIKFDSEGFRRQWVVSLEDGQVEAFYDKLSKPHAVLSTSQTARTYADHVDLRAREKYSRDYHDAIAAFAEKNPRDKLLTLLSVPDEGFGYSQELEHKLYCAILSNLSVNPTLNEKAGAFDNGTGPLRSSKLAERLAEIDSYALENPGKPVSDVVLRVFPEIGNIDFDALPLPTEPPMVWPAGRIAVEGKLENPAQFIKRVYGPWEGKGLSKKLIKNLDEPLYRALYSWLRSNEMPEDLDLPTIAQQNTRTLGDLTGSGTVGEHTLREAERLRSAVRRRVK